MTRSCSIRSGIFLRGDNISCTGHSFSSQLQRRAAAGPCPSIISWPSARCPDGCLGPGDWCRPGRHLPAPGPPISVQYYPSLASTDSYQCSRALIIHAAESHSHQIDSQTGKTTCPLPLPDLIRLGGIISSFSYKLQTGLSTVNKTYRLSFTWK